MNQAAILRRSRKNHRTTRASSRRKFAPPLRLTPALCGALAAVLCLWQCTGARAEDRAPQVKTSSFVLITNANEATEGALVKMKVGGKPLAIPFPVGAKYSVGGDASLIQAKAGQDTLLVMAAAPGNVVLTIEIPAADGNPATLLNGVTSLFQKYTLRIVDEKAAGTPPAAPTQALTAEMVPTISAGTAETAIPPRSPALTIGNTLSAVDVIAAPPAPVIIRASTAPRVTSPLANKVEATLRKTVRVASAKQIASKGARLTEALSSGVMKNLSKPVLLASEPAKREANFTAPITTIASAQMAPRPLVPSLGEITPITPKTTQVEPSGVVPSGEFKTTTGDVPHITEVAVKPREVVGETTNDADVVVTPDVPPPAPGQLPTGTASYPLQAALPQTLPQSIDPTAKRPLYRVSQGMARLLAFKSNILSVFFSDDVVMDARAVNARTIAVTGKGAGKSTLAVFLSRYPGDAVGRAVIYNIEVFPSVGRVGPVFMRPEDAEIAIRTALNDPRITVSVLQKGDGQLVATLSGALRDQAEVTAATTITSLYVPNVVSGLYVDAKALSLPESRTVPLQGDQLLQVQLQRLFSNDTIELLPLAGGTMLKAIVNSPAEAEAILAVLPTLSRQIQPMIVIRGSSDDGRFYTPTRPMLYGEDYEMTRKMNEVTGVNTVYAVRTARNALAVYGKVRSRGEYDVVRRYATTLLPQLQETVTTTSAVPVVNGQGTTGAGTPTATTATTTTSLATAPALAAAAGLAPSPVTAPLTGLTDSQNPAASYKAPVQLQMFVRVEDEDGGTVRMVTVDSNVVEINRSAIKNLGTQFGSATLTSETFTPGNPGTTTVNGGVITITGATPSVTTREIDPAVKIGQFLGGDFAGSGAISNIDPFRVQLNALIQNGSVRVLSKPNITVLEGADAQITIGGVRPVPKTTNSGAAGGTQQTSIEFRRFGILLTVRPTLTDDDTIILQIRGDVTNLDDSVGITIGTTRIPGESVRSVDTTVSLREGDTLVLGGLITNDTRKQTSKVPILGDLPVIGALFRSKRFENNESELAMFMTPHIRRMKASPETRNAVNWVPSLPDLPSQVDEQQNAFGLSTAGQGSGS